MDGWQISGQIDGEMDGWQISGQRHRLALYLKAHDSGPG